MTNAHRYLTNGTDCLNYKRALSLGLPIGSGMIKSGHRHVLQARLKKTGPWLLINAKCDYGTIRVLQLPRSSTISGPGQVQNQFEADPSVQGILNILRVQGGEFVSLLEPPAEYLEAARSCENVKTWPVLAGAPAAPQGQAPISHRDRSGSVAPLW